MTEDSRTQISRTCYVCDIEKPLVEFPRNSKGRDGRAGKCNVCAAAYMQARRTADPERSHREKRESRLRNLDAARARDRRYREANKEKTLAYQAQWRAENREARAAYNREWRRKHPERWAERRSIRKAQKLGATVTKTQLDELWTGSCGLCGELIDPNLKRPNQMSKSIDHKVPLALGGNHTQENLQWTHLLCNLIKGARYVTE